MQSATNLIKIDKTLKVRPIWTSIKLMEAAISSLSLSLSYCGLCVSLICLGWFGIVALPAHLYLFQPKGCCSRG